jgi:hypothetical protein
MKNGAENMLHGEANIIGKGEAYIIGREREIGIYR